MGRKKEYYYIERPIQDKKISVVLSKHEIQSLFQATHNLKHLTTLAVIYSCGLRVSEIIKQTALKAKIYNPITPYTRRNSFTTHLIHNGIDIKYRQIILGHSDIKIAQI